METLLSPRFENNETLTRCLNGQHRMLTPEQSRGVTLVQEALLDAGYQLPRKGADGHFGAETSAAVVKFKENRGLTPTDGVVGPKTAKALDTLYLLADETPLPLGRDVVDFDHGDAANIKRIRALRFAIEAIKDLKARFEPNPADETDPVVQAFHKFMFTQPDSNFWPTVNAALPLLERNLATQSHLRIDRTVSDYAHVDASLNPALGVTLGEGFFNTNTHCQREVVTHEYFHFVVGAQHFYDATTTADALRCPHHLTELVFQIATGQVEGCQQGEVCL